MFLNVSDLTNYPIVQLNKESMIKQIAFIENTANILRIINIYRQRHDW